MSPHPVAKLSRILAGIALVSLVLAPILTRLHAAPLSLTLLLVPISALLGLVAVILAIVGLRKSAGANSAALTGLAGGAIPVVFFASVVVSGRGLPMIHDITTDLSDPPAFVTAPTMKRDALNSLEYDRANAPQQQAAFADLRAIQSSEPPAQAFEHALAVAKSLGWEVYGQDAEHGRIEAVETTALFGFKDDVIIRIRARESGSTIDLRSVSRVGEGDLGANAKRIRRFITAYGAH